MYSVELEKVLGEVLSLPKEYFNYSVIKIDKGRYSYIRVLFEDGLFEYKCELTYTEKEAVLYVGNRICEYSKPQGLVDALNSILKYIKNK